MKLKDYGIVVLALGTMAVFFTVFGGASWRDDWIYVFLFVCCLILCVIDDGVRALKTRFKKRKLPVENK